MITHNEPVLGYHGRRKYIQDSSFIIKEALSRVSEENKIKIVGENKRTIEDFANTYAEAKMSIDSDYKNQFKDDHKKLIDRAVVGHVGQLAGAIRIGNLLGIKPQIDLTIRPSHVYVKDDYLAMGVALGCKSAQEHNFPVVPMKRVDDGFIHKYKNDQLITVVMGETVYILGIATKSSIDQFVSPNLIRNENMLTKRIPKWGYYDLLNLLYLDDTILGNYVL